MDNETPKVVSTSTSSGTGRAVVGHQWPTERELRIILSDDFDESRTAALIAWIYQFA